LLDDDFLITIPTKIPMKEDVYQLLQNEDKFYKYMINKINTFLKYPKVTDTDREYYN